MAKSWELELEPERKSRRENSVNSTELKMPDLAMGREEGKEEEREGGFEEQEG